MKSLKVATALTGAVMYSLALSAGESPEEIQGLASSDEVAVEFSDYLNARMPDLNGKVQRALYIPKITAAQYVEALVLVTYKGNTGKDLDTPIVIRIESLDSGNKQHFELDILNDEGAVVRTVTKSKESRVIRNSDLIRYGFRKNHRPARFEHEKSPTHDRKFQFLTSIANRVVLILMNNT